MQLFDLPISKAAKKLGIGVTVLKKICRSSFKVARWPCRKRQSIHKLMAMVRSHGVSSNQRAEAGDVCRQLQGFLDELLEDPNKDLDERIIKLRQVRAARAVSSVYYTTGKGADGLLGVIRPVPKYQMRCLNSTQQSIQAAQIRQWYGHSAAWGGCMAHHLLLPIKRSWSTADASARGR